MVTSVLLRFDKLQGETAKAVLLEVRGVEHWFPRRLCRNFILNKKLGGNTSIPAWLYREKFGELPEDVEATVTVEHHIPTPVAPVTTVESLNTLSK